MIHFFVVGGFILWHRFIRFYSMVLHFSRLFLVEVNQNGTFIVCFFTFKLLINLYLFFLRRVFLR